MNYLYKNRDNSRKLPFDVMNIIYDHADPMINIRKQIENKEYDLDDIMYKRYIQQIKKRITIFGLGGFHMDFYEYIDARNIHQEKHRQPILNHYKQHILYYERNRRRVCGIDIRYNLECLRTKIIMDLEAGGVKVNRKHSSKQLYEKWLKL